MSLEPDGGGGSVIIISGHSKTKTRTKRRPCPKHTKNTMRYKNLMTIFLSSFNSIPYQTGRNSFKITSAETPAGWILGLL